MKILILGGDSRTLHMIKYYKDYDIDIVGFDLIIPISKSLYDINISLYDIIIFPIDGLRNDNSIYSPFNEDKIVIEDDFFFKAKKNVSIFSGIKSEKLKELSTGLKYIKLLEDEDVCKENGILTAEGIISDIITNTPISLKDSTIIVLGYGNIGKPLVKALRHFNASVYIGINCEDIFVCEHNTFYTNKNFDSITSNADVIINTVPSLIYNEERLKKVKKSCYLLDVSSYPFGIDYTKAKELDLKIKRMPGIPGKVSPESASLILSKKIDYYL